MRDEQSVRPAIEADLQSILEIARASPEAPQWSLEQYADMLREKPYRLQQRVLLVAEVGGQVAGFAVASSVAGEAEVEGVAVAPEFRRLGVGRELCAALMQWAKTQKAATMLLEVRVSNVNAQLLYQRLGFARSGTRKHYYSDPVEDAVLMSATL